GDAVAVSGLDVPVEAVVGDVEAPVGEPAREGRVVPVEHLREGGVPVQEFARLVGPEAEPVGLGTFVEFGCRDGGRGEVGVGREAPGLLQKAVDVTHVSLRASLLWGAPLGHFRTDTTLAGIAHRHSAENRYTVPSRP